MSGANDAFAQIAGPVARALLGDPNKQLSSKAELRFGSHGSLSVDLKTGRVYDHSTKDGGGVLWLVEREKGFKGKEAVDWLKRHGFELPDDRPRQANGAGGSSSFNIVATYIYVDESGNEVFQVVRLDPKDFRQRRRAGPNDDPAKVKNGWVWSVKGIKQVPYRLPDLIEARDDGATIFIVEGEKDVENLAKIGVPATTNAMGAGKWPDELTPYFEDADVVLIPDNDEPGRAHRDLVAGSLKGVAKRVRVFNPPVKGDKEDISDWIAAGGTADALYDLVDAQSYDWRAPSEKPDGVDNVDPTKPFVSRYGRLPWSMLDAPGPEHEFLIDDFLTVGDKSVIGGPSRSGKSFLAIHASLAIARGTRFFGRPVKKGLVVYQAGEGVRGIKNRLRAYRQYFGVPKSEDVAFELLQSAIDLWRPDGDTGPLIQEIKAIAALHSDPLRLVVIDTLATATGGADENSGKDMSAVMKNIGRINAETGAHVMLVHHMNAAGSKLRGHTSVYANLDQAVFVTRDEKTKVRTVILDKQKDGEDGISFQFELLSCEIGLREDKRPITSCVVVDLGERKREIESRAKKQGFKLRNQEIIVFKALLAALKAHGEQAPSELGLPLGTQVVRASAWKQEFEAIASFETGDDSDEGKTKRAAAIRQALKRSGETLLRFGVIGRREPYLWWTGKPVADFPETFERDAIGAKRDASDQSRDENDDQRDAAAGLRDDMEVGF